MTFPRYMALLISVFSALYLGTQMGREPLQDPLLRNTYFEVCRLVEDNYFDDSPTLRDWAKLCRQRAVQFEPARGLAALITDLDLLFGQFTVSHLSIWDPLAMRSQWLGESRETGIRVRNIEGHFVVFKLVAGSGAESAGIEIGDEILSIEGRVPLSEWMIQSTGGTYQVLRQNETLEIEVGTSVLRIDLHPVFERVTNESGVLTIPSFVPGFFEKEYWIEIVKEFQGLEFLVIDLRGNTGGNFAAMLRALSPFACGKAYIGRLVKPRRVGGSKAELEDNLNPEYQLDLVEKAAEIQLKTFDSYGCYQGDMVILIDGKTASTAEVFAQALTHNERARVWGDFSAGEVVQAVWHPLPLGDGYGLSIPDSMFETPEGQGLEGVGVRPLRLLKYQLEEARQGLDSWIQAAFNN